MKPTVIAFGSYNISSNLIRFRVEAAEQTTLGSAVWHLLCNLYNCTDNMNMKPLFLVPKQSCAFMAMRALGLLRLINPRASFSSSAVKWEGGVSMVQGASRGIGLEFVSFFFIYFTFMWLIGLYPVFFSHSVKYK